MSVIERKLDELALMLRHEARAQIRRCLDKH